MNTTIYITIAIISILLTIPFIWRNRKVYLQRQQEKSYVKGTNGYNWNKLKEKMLDGKTTCIYCKKRITIKETTPLHEVEKLFTQNIANDYFHNHCWKDFQYDV